MRFLEATFRALDTSGPALRSLMAEAQRDADFLVAFRTRFILVRRASLTQLLQAAVDRGELPAKAAVAVLALYGALWYRLLLDEPLDTHLAQGLARLVLGGLRA
jgi:hypothetical protein